MTLPSLQAIIANSPTGGLTFLLRQESKQRSRHRGERSDRRQWRKKEGERVAAVGKRRACFDRRSLCRAPQQERLSVRSRAQTAPPICTPPAHHRQVAQCFEFLWVCISISCRAPPLQFIYTIENNLISPAFWRCVLCLFLYGFGTCFLMYFLIQ